MKTKGEFIFLFIVLFTVYFADSIMAQASSAVVVLPTLHEALETGLKNNYDIKMDQQSVEIFRGEKQAANGAFDPLVGVDISTLFGILQPDMTKDPSKMDVYLALPTRLGINLTTGFSYLRLRDVTNGYQPKLANGVWLQLNVPVLKGFGKTNRNLIHSKIAELKLSSGQANLDYEIMRFIKDIALAYLDTFYKNQAYNTKDQIISDLEEYKNGIQLRIENNAVVSAEILNISAELEQMKSDRSASFNDIKTAYLAFLNLLGLEAAQPDMETFVIPFTPPGIDKTRIKHYINDVMEGREGIVNRSPAFKKQKFMEEALSEEVKRASYERRNDLQLQIRYNYYSELDGGRWNSFWIYPKSIFPGSSYQLTLSYKLPLGNNTARGFYAAKKSEYESKKTASEKLFLEMKNTIKTQSNDLLNSIEVLDMQKEITGFRKQAYQNEVLKYDKGNSTQIDVLQSHQDYRESLLMVHQKEYIVFSNWLNLKFLCNDIPQKAGQLTFLFN